MSRDHWRRRTAALSVLIAVATQLTGCTVDAVDSADDSSSEPTSVTTPATRPSTVNSSTTVPPAPPTAETSAAVPPPEQPDALRRVGVFVTAAGITAVVGSGLLTTYSVAVEESLGLDPNSVAAVVDRTLSDGRGWTANGMIGFQRVDSEAGLEIIIGSARTVDARCRPLQTDGIYSCRAGRTVNINADRWLGATSDWTLDLEAYRNYVVNHEVGHALGQSHEQCPGDGAVAPVMLQQTVGLFGCIANPWPYPDNPPGPVR